MTSYTSNYLRLLSYTKLLTSHVNQGRHEQALSLFHHIHSSLSLDPFVFPLALKSCAALNSPQLGTSIHAHTHKAGLLSNSFVACALVDMYGKCISILSARQLFDEIPQRNDVVWNAMISLYTHSKNVPKALELFEVMDVLPNESTFNSIIAGFSEAEDGGFKAIDFCKGMLEFGLKPNLITILALLPACVGIASLNFIKEIHGYSSRNDIDPHPQLRSGLVEAYGRCGCLANARNDVVWNAMISLYTHSKNVPKALELFEVMDVLPNESTFNSIIAGFSEAEDGGFKAIDFCKGMLEFGLKPNLITILALLPACVGIASLNFIKEIHGYSIRNDIDPHPQLRSGLVEAYGRCGCLGNARYVFQSMSERDVVAWSSLISAYALHGEARTALDIFTQMEKANIKPDGITFIAVLKACSHAGLADEARMYFARMHNHYDVEASSDHYSCLVDVLSRAGRLYEAYEVIKEMPVKVTAKAWGALLGACRTYGEVDLAEIAGRALFEVEPNNPANYVLLARIYATAGRHEEAQRMRREMEERGVKVAPGSSWVIYQD
ncbi:unnamed protein product [Ilex paraguariensis]|uniref:Pentatricopeptide repeat-containing protein n=1 Tax=Ilex paraguariensis TaxID=185542 RepID=A0ABC8SW13_9AQUA